MNIKRMTLKKGCFITVAVYIVLAVAFYAIAHDQLTYRLDKTEMLSPTQPVGELVAGTVLEQPFSIDADEITGISFLVATYVRENTGRLLVSLVEKSGRTLAQTQVDVSQFVDNSVYTVLFNTPVTGVKGQGLIFRIEAKEGALGSAVTIYTGNNVKTGRIDVPQQIAQNERAVLNGTPLEGMLCFQVNSRTHLWFGQYYWIFALGLLALLTGYCARLVYRQKKGRTCLGLNILSALDRYRFLIEQLVARDFKTKYKRSVLGVLWSFLNPLLTMVVQYIVFSTLFASGIPNFALYLITGIVCFNFFSEATSMALLSIVGNASLITKVYVPKYIYPLSRVFSSTINLLLSLIPLFLVLIITKTPVTLAALLLPFGLLCLAAFCMGVGLLLSSAMVFFRDTQFLWGVLSMMWMYATPIFYPESIIPAKFMVLYKLNPLYHIIRFIRIVLMDGISPEPKAYLLCFLVSFIPFVIGAIIFKKTQDRFVLNI